MVNVSNLEQYFNYMKEMYLKTFDKYLDGDIKKHIIDFTYDKIIFEHDGDFDIKVSNTIKYRLDLKSFIEHNNLEKENINDLNQEEQEKVKYILDNKDNFLAVVQNSLLETMVLYFISNKDVLSYGMSTYISNTISNKFHLKTLNTYYKEAEIIKKLIEILGEKKIFKYILNGKIDELENDYNKLISDDINLIEFKKIYSLFQTEFNHYIKNKSKMYYIDSLYNYGNLNYCEGLKILEKVNKQKDNKIDIYKSRIKSIVESILELGKYPISEVDKNNLYYAKLNIDRILEKKMDYSKQIEEIIEIEKNLKYIADNIWNYSINFEGKYDPKGNCYLLIQNINQETDDNYSVMNLITNKHTRVSINKNRYKYGYIYEISSGAIIYSSPSNIILKRDNNKVEIEEQLYSTLLTPNNLFKKTLEQNSEYNNVLVNKEFVRKKAIYAICTSKDDQNYIKAYELATKFELPFIPLYESDLLIKHK